MIEEFKEINLWYHISNLGNVFSRKTKKILKPCKDNSGYLFVCISYNNERKLYRIHRLVAQAFIPNPNKYRIVDHIDRDKLNNNISNLRWIDDSASIVNTGVFPTNKLGYKGIGMCSNKYTAQIKIKGKRKYLGRFINIEDAIKARKEAEEEYWKEFNER